MLGLQGAGSGPDGFVQVTPGAELEHDVNMSLGLEGVDEIDNVGVRTELGVARELLGSFVNGKGGIEVTRSGFLGQALDGNELVGGEILRHD